MSQCLGCRWGRIGALSFEYWGRIPDCLDCIAEYTHLEATFCGRCLHSVYAPRKMFCKCRTVYCRKHNDYIIEYIGVEGSCPNCHPFGSKIAVQLDRIFPTVLTRIIQQYVVSEKYAPSKSSARLLRKGDKLR